MGDPVITGPLLLKAGGAIFSGVSAMQSAKAEKQQAEINSYIGRTRAIQTDVNARAGIESELGTIRATLAANQQQPGVGTLEVLKELRGVRGRERRIDFANRMQEAADWRMAGKNAGKKASAALAGGFIGAGPSLFDLYQYQSG